MKKRILIFGVGLDRELDISEYGDSVSYDQLCEDINNDWDDEDVYECIKNGGSWFVRGCKGLLKYYHEGDVWEGGDVDNFIKNVIKYKGRDVDWNKNDEDNFIKEFFDTKKDYKEYVKSIKNS
jgi:hypothetical protein